MLAQKCFTCGHGKENGQLEGAKWVELKLGTLSYEISTVDNLSGVTNFLFFLEMTG